jgi:hypothetical protein
MDILIWPRSAMGFENEMEHELYDLSSNVCRYEYVLFEYRIGTLRNSDLIIVYFFFFLPLSH